MSIVLTIVVFLIIFSVLVLIHEFGHFYMAKRAGIKVEEFGFGLPPRLWGKKKGETIYSINWIPFGGFVRMLGEDAGDPKMLKKKRSFIAQPVRARIGVIVAGVVMNFFLAWLLLTIGFTAGMEPLLGPDDILPAVSDGTIELVEGVKIGDVREGSLAEEVGFKKGDILYTIDGEILDDFALTEIGEDPRGVYEVYRGDRSFSYEITDANIGANGGEEGLGLKFTEFSSFPRVKIHSVDKNSIPYEAGLRPGDYVLTVNGEQIFTVSQFDEAVRGMRTLDYEVYREGERQELIVEFPQGRRVVVSRVVPGGAAETAGIREGDVIVSVNGHKFDDSAELVEFSVSESEKGDLAYTVERDGKDLYYELKANESGLVGVVLSELTDNGYAQGVELYNSDLLSSVANIKHEKYPIYISIFKSVDESFRMAKMTASMFVGVAASLVQDMSVPETVAGPIGIAQMTHDFVQQGVIPLLRFVAILSLSLAVINILPFPGLDGGRLLFVIIEILIGRRVNQKWEGVIHMLGYVLILLLIGFVTWSDITRLIGS